MGRKKTYDRNEMLARATALFRRQGFTATSADNLVNELGVNRYSLYAEFGSKQGLFDAVLERYDSENVERNFGPLELPGAGLAEIRALFESMAEATHDQAAGLGCLLCNTAVEFGPEDPGGHDFVQRYFQRVSAAFHSAIENAVNTGEALPDTDAEMEAAHFTATVLGIFVLLRAKAPARLVEQSAHAAVSRLEVLRMGEAGGEHRT